MVVVEDESDSSDLDLDQLRIWAEDVLLAEGYPESTELALLLVSDGAMAELHSTSLGKAGSTDVLSFPIEHLTPGEVATSSVGPVVAGDVVLAPEYIRRQAADLGVDELDEFALMVTHGVLHCLGYDHDAEADAVLMEGRERELLARWGRSRR